MPHPTAAMTHSPLETRAIRTLARSVYREMQAAGYSGEHMVDFASTMLDLVREHWRSGAPAVDR